MLIISFDHRVNAQFDKINFNFIYSKRLKFMGFNFKPKQIFNFFPRK